MAKTAPERVSPYGRFVGRVVSEWNDDGRTMTLKKPFSFIDSTARHWKAPAGSVVDGASIPRIAWSIIGGPFEGKYRKPSVIHDVACVKRDREWQEVHRMFYYGMVVSGVRLVTAKIMYGAVYHFGPRWPPARRRSLEIVVDATPDPIAEADFDKLKAAIELTEKATTSGMSLDAIERFNPNPIQPIVPRAALAPGKEHT